MTSVLSDTFHQLPNVFIDTINKWSVNKAGHTAIFDLEEEFKMQQKYSFWYLTEILKLHTSFNIPSPVTLALNALKVGKPEWALWNHVHGAL